jgi:hypothetical protein
MNTINKWVIGTLPFTILFSFVFYKWQDLSYYFTLGASCTFLFFLNLISNKQFVVKKYTFWILGFGVYMVLSNTFIAQNTFIFYNEVIKNQFIYAFFVINIIENTKFTEQQMRRSFQVFELTIWIALIVILVQQFYNRDFLQNTQLTDAAFEKSFVSESESRFISIFSWSGTLDHIFYFIPICFFVINYELNRDKLFKAILFTIILVTFCVISKTRTSMMPAALVFIILRTSYHHKTFNTVVNRAIVFIVLLFAMYIAFTNIPLLQNILKDRILESSRVDEEAKTMNTRVLAVKAFIKFFPDKPLLGAGNTKYSSGSKGQWNYALTSFLHGRSSQIHVGLLDLFYLYGLVGGSIFVMFFYSSLRRFSQKSKIYNFRAVYWALMTLPVANIGLVSFNLMSAGLLISFMLFKNMEVFCDAPKTVKKKMLSTVNNPQLVPITRF